MKPIPYEAEKNMKVIAYIHSLKDHKNNRHVLDKAEIIRKIGDNLYLAEYNGIRCTAIFNPFAGTYFVDDVYGIQEKVKNG
ncbi:hypothetical protein [Anaerotruncus colihominis]|nr:hypothetical protein [Anaerotruncus colihominis]